MLHEHAGPTALRIVRTAVFGLWFLIVLWTPLHAWAELPPEVFSPPGLLAVVPNGVWEWFRAPPVLIGFRWSLLATLMVTVLLRRPPTLLLLASAGGTFLFHGFVLGHGTYLNHARFGLLYVGIALALASAWEKHTTSANDREERISRPTATLRLLALLMAVTYALIGLHRFFVGGWAIFANDALPTYIMARTFEPGSYEFELGYVVVGSAAAIAVLKLGFVVTTLAEAASPLAVFHRPFRLAWLAVIMSFHLVTLLTMNIFFWENLVLIGLLFTELPSKVERRWSPEAPPDPSPRG